MLVVTLSPGVLSFDIVRQGKRSYLTSSENKKTRSPEDEVDGFDDEKWDPIFSFIKITNIVKVKNIVNSTSGVARTNQTFKMVRFAKIVNRKGNLDTA